MVVGQRGEGCNGKCASELRRRQELFSAGVVSREELDRFTREADVAKARYQSAVEQHSLVDDCAREEDRSFAGADRQLSRAQLDEAQAKYDKTFAVVPSAPHHTAEEPTATAPIPMRQEFRPC